MSYDDICKLLVIKQAQLKKDREAAISVDYLRTGKNHKAFKQFKKEGIKVINL